MNCSNRDIRYMDLASNEASKSLVSYKHGCVAVVSGKIVAKGCNNYRTYSRDGMIHNTCSCHAEISVLRKCVKQNVKKKITLYIARVSSANTLSSSQPCVDCYNTMKKFDIKRLIYSNNQGEIIKRDMNTFTSNFISSGKKAIHQNRVKILTNQM